MPVFNLHKQKMILDVEVEVGRMRSTVSSWRDEETSDFTTQNQDIKHINYLQPPTKKD